MSKEESITKAFTSIIGKQWLKVEPYADENGWVKFVDMQPEVLHIMTDVLEVEKENPRWRPKSLKGIENQIF